ncbi:spore germination protein [Sporolactobacillus sp. CPB3-1]|uniref:Spore germination protein n=1 Tax=Sporolactobacillus mangiferae TaxID=2940498 RepID=A0ABT0MD31_9BACL|nr:spore germination protein [Sporolactobacillus mangiferae]
MTKDTISKAFQLSPISAFFLTFSLQLGSDFLKLPQPLIDQAGQDAWIGVLISGFATMGILWFIFRLLDHEKPYGRTDIFSIHRRLFGKKAGDVLNFILMGQVLLFLVCLLCTYSEIFQVWLFPNLSTLEFSIIICIITGYVVLGGIRNIGGLSFLYFLYMIPIFQSLNFTVPYLRFSNLLPVFDHSLSAIMEASYMGAKLYLGFELVIFYYPFFGQPDRARKWAYLGVLTSMILYLNLTIVGTAFATQGALTRTIWPFMALLKTLQIPFFNHAEKLATLFFVWSLIPDVCVCTWILTRGLNFSFPSMKQKYFMIAVLILSVLLTCSLQTGNQIRMINQLFGLTGTAIVYIYLPLLFLYQWFHKKVREQHEN